jgi:transcriptional adapter 2-alpha
VAECSKVRGLRLADARPLVKIDVNKTRKLYDFFVKKGLIFLPEHGKSLK